jgi:hypothetical protein
VTSLDSIKYLTKKYRKVLLYTAMFFPYFVTKVFSHEKIVYIVSTILLILLFLIFKNSEIENFSPGRVISSFNNVSVFIPYIGLFIFTFITQNLYLDFETISWDVSSYLVASLPIGDGYLPFETQWESKGPLLMYIYYFLASISSKSYVVFRLVNDFILFIISVLLFKSLYLLSEKSNTTASIGSLLFLSLFSDPQYMSEYSELYILLILSITTYLYIRNKLLGLNQFTIPALISLAALINQVAVLFIVPYFFLLYADHVRNKKLLINFSCSFLFPLFIFQVIYFFNGEYNILIANYFLVPLGYSSSGDVNSINELRIWLREYFYLNKFLYLSLFSLLSFEIMRVAKQFNLYFFKNLINLNIIVSIIIYFLGNHSYAHHLMYFIYFLTFFITRIKFNNMYILLLGLMLVTSSSIFVKSFNKSFDNLSNINSVQNNYPVYKLSKEIQKQFQGEYNILALEYVLVLFYLEKPNYSYIVHPTNHFEEYINKPLERFEKIEKNNIDMLLARKPDVIICNTIRIHRGVPTDNENFNCNFDYYSKEYSQIDTSNYRNDIKVEFYYDPYKDMNVYIKKLGNK